MMFDLTGKIILVVGGATGIGAAAAGFLGATAIQACDPFLTESSMTQPDLNKDRL